MNINKKIKSLDWLRDRIIGRNVMIPTPYGSRPLVYTDYTASGRAVDFIENYLQYLLKFYANSHTKDDFTGKTMTERLHQAETRIKELVNAGKKGRIIFCGTGATGGITRLQQILGVYWSPSTKNRLMNFINKFENSREGHKLQNYINQHQPVVFVSSYEHHSNEIMWRHTLCDVVETPLDKDGYLDLNALEDLLKDEKYRGRDKIGSFSAASNVTGIKTPVYEVARLLHKYDAIACFDFAACAPYQEINMNIDEESYFDAIFLSPHKFLGGPGSSGLLVFNEKIYHKELPPTVSAGGTVVFVNFKKELFSKNIEEREKPGTPGILQDIKSALVFDLKDKIGTNNIEEIEVYYLKKFQDYFRKKENLEFYGPQDPARKINIIPFNIRYRDKWLHPKFVTSLLNDLFGIQTRAGCLCAGPYGHRLLDINEQLSEKLLNLIQSQNYNGLKPGWVRLNIHYTLSELEFDYVVQAVELILEKGYKFLPFYKFNMETGEWRHIRENEMNDKIVAQDINAIIDKFKDSVKIENSNDSEPNYKIYLDAAVELAEELQEPQNYVEFDEELQAVINFPVCNLA